MSSKPSLWKQLLGAGIGMGIALALYGAYRRVTPLVTGYLLPPGVTVESDIPQGVGFSIEADAGDERYARIGERARRIAERLEEEQTARGGNAWDGLVADAPSDEDDVPAIPMAFEEILPDAPSQTAGMLRAAAADRAESRSTGMREAAGSSATTHAASAEHAGAPRLPSSGRATMAFALLASLIGALCLDKRTRASLIRHFDSLH
jgi:hypothetical protein